MGVAHRRCGLLVGGGVGVGFGGAVVGFALGFRFWWAARVGVFDVVRLGLALQKVVETAAAVGVAEKFVGALDGCEFDGVAPSSRDGRRQRGGGRRP